MRDLDSVDFRGDGPLTYGIGDWQFKLGYYHLSSHLGDEYAINNPGSLDEWGNYVRDTVIFGASHYPIAFMRLYAETAYAFNATDGAEPWEFQFGTELSRPGVKGPRGTPFLVLNALLREEHDFGGDFTAETGWLSRGRTGQVMRIGAFYFNGNSSQYQFYNDSQQQVGAGIWYDF
jgi:outer membrane protein assembly factor BamB